MLRFLILSGYFELVMYLQVSGKLNQYINIHYSYLAYISMILSFILAVVQLIVWMKQMKVHSHLSGRVAKVASIAFLAFPVLTGLLVPTEHWMQLLSQQKAIIFHWRQEVILIRPTKRERPSST